MNDSRTGNARRLRREATPAERKLWSMLRGRRLDNFKFRRQVPIDRYFADFVCMSARLIIEIDGWSHDGREKRDAERTRVLESLGYRIIRFRNSSVLEASDAVWLKIADELRLGRG